MAEATSIKAKNEQGYWAFVNKQFRKKKTAVISLYIVIVLALIAVFARFWLTKNH
jgi:ABC-type antimicrobial peptide transport system permease subunit